tara:strand:- start:257 stop:529 length:273 start_codon:yes stop_codon:yes gene_type:complete
MANVKKLTPRMLRKMVLQEKKRYVESLEQGKDDTAKVEAEEVDADELATTLEKDLDHLKVLKIKEQRLRTAIRKVNEAKKRVRQRVIKRI